MLLAYANNVLKINTAPTHNVVIAQHSPVSANQMEVPPTNRPVPALLQPHVLASLAQRERKTSAYAKKVHKPVCHRTPGVHARIKSSQPPKHAMEKTTTVMDVSTKAALAPKDRAGLVAPIQALANKGHKHAKGPRHNGETARTKSSQPPRRAMDKTTTVTEKSTRPFNKHVTQAPQGPKISARAKAEHRHVVVESGERVPHKSPHKPKRATVKITIAMDKSMKVLSDVSQRSQEMVCHAPETVPQTCIKTVTKQVPLSNRALDTPQVSR